MKAPFVRYTPLLRDMGLDHGFRADKPNSGVTGANLILSVEPFHWGRYGNFEGATIYFIDGQTRHVNETVSQILERITQTNEGG